MPLFISNGAKMENPSHTILFVDDDGYVLSSLKRLLRKENYTILTAISGSEGLRLLEENEVQLVISDQRMPEMNGTEFLSLVKTRYPDILRIILTGYTEISSITESINKGNIYKFFVKPWNDQALKLEIRLALQHYDLVRENRSFQTKMLNKDQSLEMTAEIIESIAFPIIGIGADGSVVFCNRNALGLKQNGIPFKIGQQIQEYFSNQVRASIERALISGHFQIIGEITMAGTTYALHYYPLSGQFLGQGALMYVDQTIVERREMHSCR